MLTIFPLSTTLLTGSKNCETLVRHDFPLTNSAGYTLLYHDLPGVVILILNYCFRKEIRGWMKVLSDCEEKKARF